MADYKQTPSQTVGPFFAYGLTAQQYIYDNAQIADACVFDKAIAVKGEEIVIIGQIFDGKGVLVPDAMIEVWQADGTGNYDVAGSNGFGRAGTGMDPHNRFIFETVKPLATGQAQAPCLTLIVFMRGLLRHVYTRLYFSDERDANQTDSVLNSVPAPRRQTLIAELVKNTGRKTYQFNIHMQGDEETVFFDISHDDK